MVRARGPLRLAAPAGPALHRPGPRVRRAPILLGCRGALAGYADIPLPPLVLRIRLIIGRKRNSLAEPRHYCASRELAPAGEPAAQVRRDSSDRGGRRAPARGA